MKKNIFDLIESYYLIQFIRYLNAQQFFKEGKREIDYDRSNLPVWNMLRFIYDRTDLLINRKGTYLLAKKYTHYTAFAFHIDKLLESYGHFDFKHPSHILKLDKLQFARAKEKTFPYYDYAFLMSVLNQLNSKTILDLGCSMGGLLVKFCKSRKTRKGFGIDNNINLFRKGSAMFAAAGFGNRAKLIYGNALKMDTLLSEKMKGSVDTVVANNFLNEFFAEGNKLITGVLAKIKKAFPGKVLVVMDYYGVFGTSRKNDPHLQHNYLHDIIQIFSGQGTPPENYKAWNRYYKKTGCRLVQVYEGKNSGFNWFLHVVQL